MTPDEIAKRYDALRKSIPKITEPNLLVLTCGVAGLGAVTVTGILEKIREFDGFETGDDPYGEHDFGAIEHDGETVFWKIEDYGGMDGLELVLTVMMAEEY